MTTTMNHLRNSAIALGEYLLEAEYDQVQEEFISSSVASYEEFLKWIVQFQYYNALVCATGGDANEIAFQIRRDWEELQNDLTLSEPIQEVA